MSAPPTSGPATPVTGDLLYGEEAEDLRASVRALLDKQAPWDAVLARFDSGVPVDTDLWARLAGEVGVAGLAVDEERGGAGASWREVAVVAEELGRAVAPVPFLGSAVIATAALLDVTPTRESDELLAALVRQGVAVERADGLAGGGHQRCGGVGGLAHACSSSSIQVRLLPESTMSHR